MSEPEIKLRKGEKGGKDNKKKELYNQKYIRIREAKLVKLVRKS